MINTGNKKALTSGKQRALKLSQQKYHDFRDASGEVTMNIMTQTNGKINFDAALTFEQVEQHDHNNINVMRRIALITLTKSYDELMQIIQGGKDGEEAFMTVFEQTNSYVDYLKELLALAEAAQARVFVVGQDFLKQQEDAA